MYFFELESRASERQPDRRGLTLVLPDKQSEEQIFWQLVGEKPLLSSLSFCFLLLRVFAVLRKPILVYHYGENTSA